MSISVNIPVKFSAEVSAREFVLRNSHDKWSAYEREKRLIGDTASNSSEYERLLGDLCDRLGV